MSTFINDKVVCPQAEWDKLDENQRQFLRDAEAGGLRYQAEKGEVCAWGIAVRGIFSMDIETKPDPDGYLITLPNVD